MKAIVWTKYGAPDSLQLREVATPVPKPDEVLICVHATTVTAGEVELRRWRPSPWLQIPLRLWLGVRNPRNIILGQECAGEIAEIGEAVTRFKRGDAVFAWMGTRLGAYAEYACLRAGAAVALKPANMTYDEAACMPVGGQEALHFLKQGHTRRGESILICGAGGGIGTIAVQVATALGAEVTAVDSGDKLDMLRSIGADHVVDYTKEDFTQRGQTYDVIIDVVGKSPFTGSIRALKPNGRYMLVNPSLSHMLRATSSRLPDGKTVFIGPAKPSATALDFLRAQIEAGTIKAIVDRRYPLAQTAEAHRYAETGQKKGNVVITVGTSS
jgi:NADPH:quinone reductase-like Zn-dependent oxidoreductase